MRRSEDEVRERIRLLRGLVENANGYPSSYNDMLKPYWRSNAEILEWSLGKNVEGIDIVMMSGMITMIKGVSI
jgi:hypothetical protein